LGQILHESAFVQLGDEAGVHEFLRFVVPDIGALKGDVFVCGLQSLCDRVGDRDEIVAVDLIGPIEKLPIVGLQIFA
jgi:hypothetical protein